MLSARRIAARCLTNGPSLHDFVAEAGGMCGGGGAALPGDGRLPSWLKTPIATGANYSKLKEQMRGSKLHTVCEEARCPNIGECWNGSSESDHPATATIMIMGDECTRGCRFCAVKTNRQPAPLDSDEPARVAQAISEWKGVGYIVITSVDRDDLADGGAGHFARCVESILEKSPHMLIECLTGDFAGRLESVERVARSGLKVYAHNVETVERLTPSVRDHRATYRQSLQVLQHAKLSNPSLLTKSSIMLGCGETAEEIRQTLLDLRIHSVDAVTLGQYIRPTRRHLKVHSYIPPEQFDQWRDEAMAMGFKYVASGPLVRSSYRAGEYYLSALIKQQQQQQQQ